MPLDIARGQHLASCNLSFGGGNVKRANKNTSGKECCTFRTQVHCLHAHKSERSFTPCGLWQAVLSALEWAYKQYTQRTREKKGLATSVSMDHVTCQIRHRLCLLILWLHTRPTTQKATFHMGSICFCHNKVQMASWAHVLCTLQSLRNFQRAALVPSTSWGLPLHYSTLQHW